MSLAEDFLAMLAGSSYHIRENEFTAKVVAGSFLLWFITDAGYKGGLRVFG